MQGWNADVSEMTTSRYGPRFRAVALMEKHLTADLVLDIHEIEDRLDRLWHEIEREAKTGAFTLAADSILDLHERIARSLGVPAGTFLERDDWLEFVEDLGDIEESPGHTLSWVFSTLYWKHLSRLRLATAWLFDSALRSWFGYPEVGLPLDELGRFLGSLAGSGPPIYDGQTFFVHDYGGR